MQCGMVILNYKDSIRTEILAKRCANFKIIDKIVIVDNCSKDGSYERLSHIKNEKIEVIESNKNGGFSYGNNVGARYLIEHWNPEYIFFANPDTIFPEENLFSCMEALKNNQKLGLVSTRMVGPDNKEQTASYAFPTYKSFINDYFILGRKRTFNARQRAMNHSDKIQPVDIVRGSFQFFRSSALKDVDYFDENTFLYYEEAIISQRLKKKGYMVALLTDIQYIHDHVEEKTNNVVQSTKRMYDSEIYYAKNYMGVKGLKLIILKLLAKFSVFEIQILRLIRNK